MELVYLWVDSYKNIRNQGFNFSPRFECEFKDGNLTICDKKEKDNKCKNKDYIENFFGKNINVTAIVGENGSGKSSLIIFLMKEIFKNNNECIEINDNIELCYLSQMQGNGLNESSTILEEFYEAGFKKYNELAFKWWALFE